MSFWDRFKKKKEDKKEPKQTNTVLALKNKSPFAWTIEDVGNWLKYIGFPEYVTLFQENQIAGDVLFSLDIVDLKSMGVTVLGHRKKMMQEITTLVPDNKNRNNSEKSDEDSTNSKDNSGSKESIQSSKESSSSISTSKNLNDPIYLKVTCIFDSEEVPFVCKKSYTFKKIQNKLEEAFGINGLRIYYNGKEIVEDKIWENIAQQNSEIKFEVKRGDPNQITNTEKNVLEQILDAAIVINIKGTILYGNRAIKKHLGYSRKDLVGKNINSIMPKEYSVKHDGYLEKYLQTGKSTVIGKGRQVSIKLSNGEEKLCWLAVTENKTKHGRHTFTGTIHILSDNRSQDMNSYKILDCLRKSIFVIDIDGLVQFVNRSAEVLLGYKTEELLGQNINKIMPEPYSSRHNGYLQNYLKVGKSQIIGTKGRLVAAKASNGSLVPILLEVNEVIIEGKRFFVGVMTKQEKVEKQKSTLEETRDVLSSLLVPAVVIDKEGIIQALNDDATELLGYELVDVIGHNVTILMNDSDARKHDNYLKNYFKTGEASVIGKKRKVVAKTKDGKLKAVVLSVTERGSGDDIIFLGILLPL